MFFNNKAARRLVELASKVDTQEELLMRASASGIHAGKTSRLH